MLLIIRNLLEYDQKLCLPISGRHHWSNFKHCWVELHNHHWCSKCSLLRKSDFGSFIPPRTYLFQEGLPNRWKCWKYTPHHQMEL